MVTTNGVQTPDPLHLAEIPARDRRGGAGMSRRVHPGISEGRTETARLGVSRGSWPAPVRHGRTPGVQHASAQFGPFTVSRQVHGPTACVPAADNFGWAEETVRILVVLDGAVVLTDFPSCDLEATPDQPGLIRRHELGPYDSAIVLGWQLVGYESPGPAQVVTIDLPASGCPYLIDREITPVVSSGPSSPLLSALGAFANALLIDRDTEPSVEAHNQITEMLDLMCMRAIVTQIISAGEEWDTEGQRLYLERYVATHYTDPDLSTATVAERFGTSTRTIQRVFEGSGRTLTQTIEERRVSQALAGLRDPAYVRVPIDDLAHLTGFKSTSGLRRAVQAATGLTPREVRAQALQAAPPRSRPRIATCPAPATPLWT